MLGPAQKPHQALTFQPWALTLLRSEHRPLRSADETMVQHPVHLSDTAAFRNRARKQNLCPISKESARPRPFLSRLFFSRGVCGISGIGNERNKVGCCWDEREQRGLDCYRVGVKREQEGEV